MPGSGATGEAVAVTTSTASVEEPEPMLVIVEGAAVGMGADGERGDEGAEALK